MKKSGLLEKAKRYLEKIRLREVPEASYGMQYVYDSEKGKKYSRIELLSRPMGVLERMRYLI